MENTNVQKFLRSELSFYGTIVAAVLSIAGFYFGITNQINLMAQKMDSHIESTAYLPASMYEIKEKVAILMAENKSNNNKTP